MSKQDKPTSKNLSSASPASAKASTPAKAPVINITSSNVGELLAREEAARQALINEGRLLFAKSWIFIRGVPSMKFLPAEGPVEIAFAGRSNVGKSSLINALVTKKGLARTSNTPGRTQELNYFVPDGYSGEEGDLPPLALVDMPGYGFAEAPKSQVDAWTRLVFDYLRGRTTLKRVYVLIDSRHGIKKKDAEVLDLLDKAAVSYQIVLTKIDKIKPAGIPRLMEETKKLTIKRAACFPGIIATSSEKGIGFEELRAAIALVAKEA